jgi:hypothetical protein
MVARRVRSTSVLAGRRVFDAHAEIVALLNMATRETIMQDRNLRSSQWNKSDLANVAEASERARYRALQSRGAALWAIWPESCPPRRSWSGPFSACAVGAVENSSHYVQDVTFAENVGVLDCVEIACGGVSGLGSLTRSGDEIKMH